MTITPRAQALRDLTPVDAAHFTGNAGLRTLLPALGPLPPTSVAVVRFEPGVRNHWHSHAGGQLLVVIEGEGWVQARRAGPKRIRVGDTVVTEPNEEHWHGAGRGGPFAHLVVNIGETRWLEEHLRLRTDRSLTYVKVVAGAPGQERRAPRAWNLRRRCRATGS